MNPNAHPLHQQLASAGYTTYVDESLTPSNGYCATYQKHIKNDIGIAYVIHIPFFELKQHPNQIEHITTLFSAHVQLNTHGDTFNVEKLHIDDVNALEAFFNTMFVNMGCENYSTNT